MNTALNRRSVVAQQSTNTNNASYDSVNFGVGCSKLPFAMRNHKQHKVIVNAMPMYMQSVLQISGEIVCANIILYMVYLLMVFYKYSLVIAIQGTTTLYYNATLFSG